MAHIDEVNSTMKIINDLTDQIYEALADVDTEGLESSIKKLQKVLEKVKINGKKIGKNQAITI